MRLRDRHESLTGKVFRWLAWRFRGRGHGSACLRAMDFVDDTFKLGERIPRPPTGLEVVKGKDWK